jgi:Family of unknown function (DUF5518)
LDANTTTKSGYAQPALIGGLVMGVLSALPLVNALNLCCCLWVVSGGLVAAYLFQQNHSMPMTAGDGALAGFLAGIAGAVILVIVSIPINMLVAPMERAVLQRVLTMSGNMPPEMRQMLENLGQPRTDIGFLGQMIVRLIGFFFFLIVGSVFSTLGGLLGAALFRKSLPVRSETEPSAP